MDLEAERHLANVSKTARWGDLLATVYQNEVNLYSLRDSRVPLLLSKVETPSAVQEIALDGAYLAVSVGPQRDLYVYDIANVYAPELVNHIHNAEQVDWQALAMSRGVMILSAGNTLYYGSLLSGALAQYELEIHASESLVAIEAHDNYLYVLYSDRLELRDLAAPELIVNSLNHGLVDVETIIIDELSFSLASAQALRLYSTNLFIAQAPSAFLAQTADDMSIDFTRVKFNGDLMAVFSGSNLAVYDMAIEGETLDVNLLTDVDTAGSSLGGGLHFGADLIEWLSGAAYLQCGTAAGEYFASRAR